MENITIAMLQIYMTIQNAKRDTILKWELKAGLQNLASGISDLYAGDEQPMQPTLKWEAPPSESAAAPSSDPQPQPQPQG